jgi:hypothetical protein
MSVEQTFASPKTTLFKFWDDEDTKPSESLNRAFTSELYACSGPQLEVGGPSGGVHSVERSSFHTPLRVRRSLELVCPIIDTYCVEDRNRTGARELFRR